jgi:uncharacterized membrane protein
MSAPRTTSRTDHPLQATRQGAGHAVAVGVVVALAVGSVVGLVARLLMRVVALATGEPSFTWGGTLLVALVFVLAVLPGAVAAAVLRGRRRWAVPVLAALLMCVPATGIASDEVGSTADLSSVQWAGLLTAGLGVYLCIAALPVLTVRLVDRWR